MPTAGDIWKVYVKPSLDGEMVIRKRTSNQTSARLKARQDKLAALPDGSYPSQVAHKALVAAGKCRTKRVYKPGVGYENKDVCNAKDMAREMKKAMANI